MTNREILQIASNEDINSYLAEIKNIQDNLINKTIYEIPKDEIKIKKMVRYIQEILKDKK